MFAFLFSTVVSNSFHVASSCEDIRKMAPDDVDVRVFYPEE